MKYLVILLKGIALLVGVMLLLFVAMIAWVAYVNIAATDKADALCAKIRVGQAMPEVVSLAEASAVDRVDRPEDGRMQFAYYSFMAAGVCEVEYEDKQVTGKRSYLEDY